MATLRVPGPDGFTGCRTSEQPTSGCLLPSVERTRGQPRADARGADDLPVLPDRLHRGAVAVGLHEVERWRARGHHQARDAAGVLPQRDRATVDGPVAGHARGGGVGEVDAEQPQPLVAVEGLRQEPRRAARLDALTVEDRAARHREALGAHHHRVPVVQQQLRARRGSTGQPQPGQLVWLGAADVRHDEVLAGEAAPPAGRRSSRRRPRRRPAPARSLPDGLLPTARSAPAAGAIAVITGPPSSPHGPTRGSVVRTYQRRSCSQSPNSRQLPRSGRWCDEVERDAGQPGGDPGSARRHGGVRQGAGGDPDGEGGQASSCEAGPQCSLCHGRPPSRRAGPSSVRLAVMGRTSPRAGSLAE